MSKCCLSRYTEEPSEIDGKECTFVCATCHRECQRTRIDENLGTPRTEEQAYEDGMKDPLEGADPPKEGQTPKESGFVVKDGLIYKDGVLIGRELKPEDIK